MLGYGPISGDPISGLFGLTTGSPPPAVPQISTIGAKAFRRRTTQYTVKLPELAESNPLVASGSRTIYEQFKTRTMRGRKLAKPGWISAMAPIQQAVVIQPSAYIRPVTLRRKTTRRRVLDIPDFLSNYIAPTMAAVDLDQRPFKVRYVRNLKLVPPLSLYPPPTGPPNYVSPPRAKLVSQRRRFLSSPPQSLYPATPVQLSFIDLPDKFKRRDTKRKARLLPVIPVYPATPGVQTSVVTPPQVNRRKSQKRGFVWSGTTIGIPATPVSVAPIDATFPTLAIRRPADGRGFVWQPVTLGIPSGGTSAAPFDAAKDAREIRRKETRRKLRKIAVAPVYPTTAGAPAVPFGAITTKRIKGRKSRGLGFVSVDAIVGEPVAGTTPALYPSVEDYGYRKRRDTKRKLRTAIVAPVFTYSAPSASADRAISEPFKTRIGKGRKIQKLALAPVFPVAAPTPANFATLTQPKTLKRRNSNRKLRDLVDPPVFPVTPAAPVVYGAVVRPKTNKRKSRQPGFVLDYALVGAPQVPGYDATESYGFVRRSETARRLRKATVAPVYPQTPAPAVTLDALIPDAILRRRDTTKSLKSAIWPNVFPQTPATPAQPFEAFKTVLAKYAGPLVRRLLEVYAPQNVDVAPYVPPVDPGSGGGGGGGAGWKKHHEHKRRKDRELEDTIRQIYRELTREPATVDLAVQIVAPITAPEARAIPTISQVKFEIVTPEIETALRLVHQQIEDFKAADEKDRQELFEIIEIMHMSGLI